MDISDPEVQTPAKIAGLVGVDKSIMTPIGPLEIQFLQINPSTLSVDMKDQAAIYGWVSAAWAAVKTDVANAEQEIRERESLLWGRLRAQKEQGVKMTVDDMKQQVAADPGLQKLQHKLIGATSNMDTLRVVRDALDQRASMIQSMVGLERSKMELQLQASRAAVGEQLGKQNKGEK